MLSCSEAASHASHEGLQRTLAGVQINSDVVRRWVSEVQNAVQSKLPMVQFHALALLGTIKQKDLLAISKVQLAPWHCAAHAMYTPT